MTKRDPFKDFKYQPRVSVIRKGFLHPETVGFDERVCGFEELSRECDNSDLCWFSCGAQLGVFCLEIVVEAHGGQGRHIERVA